jgi:hypothetical protein
MFEIIKILVNKEFAVSFRMGEIKSGLNFGEYL